MMRFSLTFLVLIPAIYAYNAFHIHQNTTVEIFQCLVQSKVSYSIVRIYNASALPDSFGASDIQFAWEAGMKKVDGYIVPKFTAGYPTDQMNEAMGSIASVKVNALWIQVETSETWSKSNVEANVKFIQSMVDEGINKGYKIGIQTTNSSWNSITKGSTAFSAYPLWWYDGDTKQDFDDFKPFGGWTVPYVKRVSSSSAVDCKGLVWNAGKDYYDPSIETVDRDFLYGDIHCCCPSTTYIRCPSAPKSCSQCTCDNGSAVRNC